MAYASPIPQLGLGTFGRTGDTGVAALETAIAIGYRHIDTAQSYGSEGPVGEAIRRSGLPRDAFFVTTKVADTNLARADFMPSVERSLETLGIGPVDLLLIHWPSKNDAVPFAHYIEALADARQRGHARLIGVSNFPIADLERTRALLGPDAIATDQVEIHIYHQAPRLRDHARAHGLTLTAYQPLVKGQAEREPALAPIAARHGVAPAAVALAFLMAEGHAVIPASANAAHLRANFAATAVRLSPDEIDTIRGLDRGDRRINPEKSPAWDD
ncbi:MAG: aldo/keto reductase [Alphaproteobacteria bacterium]